MTFGMSWRLWAKEVTAAVTVTAIALPICMASGVLAYGPLGVGYVGLGAAAAILCGGVGGIVSATVRSPSFILTTPTTPSALILAGGAAGILSAVGQDPKLAIVGLPLIVLLAGLLQICFAVAGLGRLVKFAPYPVVAGFVSGIATLILVSQIPRALGYQNGSALLAGMGQLHPVNWPLVIYSLTLFALLWLMTTFAPRLPAALVILCLGGVLYHGLIILVPGIGLGPRLGSVDLDMGTLAGWIDSEKLGAVAASPSSILSIGICSMTLAFVGTLDSVMGTRAAQALDEVPSRPVKDFAAIGLGNVASAFFGGIVVTTSITLLNANFQNGGRKRISTISVAILLVLLILTAPHAIAQVPLAIFPPLLIFLGLRLYDKSTKGLLRQALARTGSATRSKARRDLLIQLSVLGPTAASQPAAGVLVGVLISCLIFIVEMSRPVVARASTGQTVASKRAWSRADTAVLRDRGTGIVVLDLQGPLFFGNSEDLSERLRTIGSDVATVILDFHRVTDIDASGHGVLDQISKRCKTRKIQVVACGIPVLLQPTVQAVFGKQFCFATKDQALEWAEQRLLVTQGTGRSASDVSDLSELDVMDGVSLEDQKAFETYLKPISLPSGAIICREGESGDRIWFIRRGSVSIQVGVPGTERRVGSLGPGTTIGEMGVLERKPRSASVVADEPVEMLVLTLENYHRLLQEKPHIGHAVLTNFARDLSDRLRARSSELAAAIE